MDDLERLRQLSTALASDPKVVTTEIGNLWLREWVRMASYERVRDLINRILDTEELVIRLYVEARIHSELVDRRPCNICGAQDDALTHDKRCIFAKAAEIASRHAGEGQ